MISAQTLLGIAGIMFALVAAINGYFDPPRAWKLGMLGLAAGILVASGIAALSPDEDKEPKVQFVTERTTSSDGTTVERRLPVVSGYPNGLMPLTPAPAPSAGKR